MRIPFLSATWSELLVVNYEIDPSILGSLTPRGTTLDDFQGKYYISLVAFRFRKNKLWGLIPTLPHNFEEANLRYYIKRIEDGEKKNAVAFVREVVPSKFIAWTARTFYNEPYISLPMSHDIGERNVSYSWGNDLEHSLKAKIGSDPKELIEGAFPHFILEHYWGYSTQKDDSTLEYEVEHPPWRYYEVSELEVSDKLKHFYGSEFSEALSRKPHSAFVAEGSPIRVHFPKRLPPPSSPSLDSDSNSKVP